MAGDAKHRARKSSHSSTDRELSIDVKVAEKSSVADSDVKTSIDSPGPRKRASADPIDYPRRRATIACEICRSRKSRCDGNKPKCRLCTELNAICVYREPGVKLDAGDKLILERLTRIESLLQERSTPQASVTSSPANTASPIDESVLLNRGAAVNGLGTWSSGAQLVSTMPKSHTTPALNLLSWPKIRDLVSRRWDPGVIVQAEMNRPPLVVNPSMPLDFKNASLYVRAFFEGVNVWYACVSPYKWHDYYRVASAQAFSTCPESCLVLLVLALGAASYTGSISRIDKGADPPGTPFFAAAWAMLPSLVVRTDVLSTQCQLLTAAYLFYQVRPLEAWNLLVSISLKLQLMVTMSLSPAEKKECERIYWNTLLFESDLLAEMELPHSGIVHLENHFTLPSEFESDGKHPVAADDIWYFTAEIGLRKLLNRVSYSIYSITSPITNTAALEPVVTDLDGELTRWYQGLPQPVRFEANNGKSPSATAVQTVLRLRYFACRTIIFRPYVLAVLIKESAFMDPSVEECCRKCLEACIRQLEHITAHHAGHLPYLFQGALSIVSQTLLVMGATLSPCLSELLPPPHQMNAIISDVVREIGRYAHLAPSLSLSADIIREADNRRRHSLPASMQSPRPG